MLRGMLCGCVGAILLTSAYTEADEESRVDLSGTVQYSFGQIVDGATEYGAIAIDHYWLQTMLGGIGMESWYADRLQIILNLEMEISLPFQIGDMSGTIFPQSQRIKSDAYFHHAEGVFHLIDNEMLSLELGMGYFPYKYNLWSRNLGEYLFRCRARPPVLNTEFDKAFHRVLGMRLKSTLYKMWTHEVVVSSEKDLAPVFDYSLSYLTGVSLANMVYAGGGVMLEKVLSINRELTYPESRNNRYVDNGDTNYYSFNAVKLMGRLAFDPKPLIGIDIFGPGDLIFYSEAAVLGVENRGIIYNDIMDRIPVMAGFNIPAFNFVDTVAVEAEWYGSPYRNSNRAVVQSNVPIFDNAPADEELADSLHLTEDNIKWSVTLTKTVAERISLAFQVANDHTKVNRWNRLNDTADDVLYRPEHWKWMARARFAF